MHMRKLAILILLLTFTRSAMAAFCTDDAPNNPCFRAKDPLAACSAQLAQRPSSTSVRIALCEALAADGMLDEAEVLIGQGISRCSGRACQKLKIAMSYLEERRSARDRADPREAERKKAADRRFCLTPFNNERSVSACEKLLLSEAKDEEIYTALIQKLLKMGEASEALAYAIKGRSEIGSTELFPDLVDEANRQRKAVVDDCLNDTSLPKCEQAYLAGAADEYQILRRQGELLTVAGRYADANETLRGAERLRPGDASVRAATAALRAAQAPPPVQMEIPESEPGPDNSQDATVAQNTGRASTKARPVPEKQVEKIPGETPAQEPEKVAEKTVEKALEVVQAPSQPVPTPAQPREREPEIDTAPQELDTAKAGIELAQTQQTMAPEQPIREYPVTPQPDIPIVYRNRINDMGTSF